MSRDDRATARHADRVRLNKIKAAQAGRDGTTHVPLPHVVLDSPGWLQASPQARAFLMDFVAPLYRGSGGAEPGRPNGGLMIEWEERLVPRGWRSKSVVNKLVRELAVCGLLCLTRQGGRRCAGLYAATWLALGTGSNYQLEIDTAKWDVVHRGAYMRPEKPVERPKVDRAAKARAALAAKRSRESDLPGLSDSTPRPGYGLSDSQRKAANGLSGSPNGSAKQPSSGLSDSRSLENRHLRRQSAAAVAAVVTPHDAQKAVVPAPNADAGPMHTKPPLVLPPSMKSAATAASNELIAA